MHRKGCLTIVLIVVISLFLSVSCGCSQALRFAPSQAQKQAAFDAYLKACAANANGAMPQSELTHRLVDETEVSLGYIGAPASPQIDDYDAMIASARVDAVKRPDANDVMGAADAGLSLAAEVAILLGVGGSTLGGKKLLDWIALARRKATAFEEIVEGNEFLKGYLKSTGGEAQLKAFGDFQANAQSEKTAELVAVARLPAKQAVSTVNAAALADKEGS